MKVKAINCKYLFTKDYIEEIKDSIKTYNQGFMVVNNNLYLPYYQVLSMHYTLPIEHETDIIELDNVTSTDRLSICFKQVDALDEQDVIDLWRAMQLDDDFSKLLAVVDEIAQARYETGYADAEE